MFSKSVLAAVLGLLTFEASAIELLPIKGPEDLTKGPFSRRSLVDPVDLIPISDPGIFTHGRSLKREVPGNGAFDPSKETTFYWGAYAGENLYLANFTLSTPDSDELILPVENFARRLKSLHCGTPADPNMVMEFTDDETFNYAKKTWTWVNDKDVNAFTVVTEPDQCYKGDNRSPFLVHDIKFDDAKRTAYLHAEEKQWHEVAHTYHLHLGHQHIDPSTANVTHPHLKPRDTPLKMATSFNAPLFKYAKNSKETAGMELSASAKITTSGALIADFDVISEGRIIKTPKDVKIAFRPQALKAALELNVQADGVLGKGLDWTMKPELEIPIAALNIKGLLSIGPFVKVGVHFGASGLKGKATFTTGARATIEDSARMHIQLKDKSQNGISGWTPKFEAIPPSFNAEIGGEVRAWNELSVVLQAKVFGMWGYQAGIDAQLPYVEANLAAKIDTKGVCGTKKTIAIEASTNVGINVNINAGNIDKAPDFRKDLFNKEWPLYSTCLAIGPENAMQTAAPSAKPTMASSVKPGITKSSVKGVPKPTGKKSSKAASKAPTSKKASPTTKKTSAGTPPTGKPTVTKPATGTITRAPSGTGSSRVTSRPSVPASKNSTRIALPSIKPSAVTKQTSLSTASTRLPTLNSTRSVIFSSSRFTHIPTPLPTHGKNSSGCGSSSFKIPIPTNMPGSSLLGGTNSTRTSYIPSGYPVPSSRLSSIPLPSGKPGSSVIGTLPSSSSASRATLTPIGYPTSVIPIPSLRSTTLVIVTSVKPSAAATSSSGSYGDKYGGY